MTNPTRYVHPVVREAVVPMAPDPAPEVDPDAGPGVERPYTGGWVEPGNVHKIVDALWAAAATPTPDEVAAR